MEGKGGHDNPNGLSWMDLYVIIDTSKYLQNDNVKMKHETFSESYTHTRHRFT